MRTRHFPSKPQVGPSPQICYTQLVWFWSLIIHVLIISIFFLGWDKWVLYWFHFGATSSTWVVTSYALEQPLARFHFCLYQFHLRTNHGVITGEHQLLPSTGCPL
jgi:membrane protein YdbS with pleckstrin-like domain